MIYLLILILVYWIFESISESMTWMASWHSTKKINPKTYHLVRLPETLAVIGSHIFIGILLKGLHGACMVAVMEIIGCVLYERVYCCFNYGDFFYNKTSKWLGIIHLKAWQEMILLVVSVAVLWTIL